MSDPASIEVNFILEALVEADVLVEDGEYYSVGRAFEERRTEWRTRFDQFSTEEVDEVVSSHLDGVDDGPFGDDLTILADAIALEDTVSDIEPETAVQVAYMLRRFTDSPRSYDLPDRFVPLRGDELHPFLVQHSASVVLFWREDCDPCDVVRDDMKALESSGEIPEGIGLATVYGPACDSKLLDRYEVGVAPTLLFFVGTTVDSRLIGAQPRESLKRELDIIAENL